MKSIVALLMAFTASAAPVAQQSLPSPSGHPLDIDFSQDPVLLLRQSSVDPGMFRELMQAAVLSHPAHAEADALEDEAVEGLEQAREARLPTVDATVTSYRVIAREFSNDPNNIIERSRAEQRTDAILQLNQTLFDFGAGAARVRAAGARLRAARADVEYSSDRVALSAIAAWYDVFGFRSLVALTEAFIAGQMELREAIELRIAQGVSAEADLPRVDSYIAQAQTRLAVFRRRLAAAEARFRELMDLPPPSRLGRAPTPVVRLATREDAAAAAASVAAVRSASASADSAQQEARAARAERLPQITGGIDAGRYGVLETERDFDIRGRLGLRWRLFGGVDARADQFAARARAAEARADRILQEAERDAAIAWADVRALEQQLEALEAAYMASRRSRDAIVERFRAARGSLFDVLAAEEAYFGAATAYIQALTELDAARYILLSRTGLLLDTLRIDPID